MAVARQYRAEEADPYMFWHRLIFAVMYPLPKTSETVDLISRVIGERMHIHREGEAENEERNSNKGFLRNRDLRHRAEIETRNSLLERPETYILGTSLTFEAAVISLAAWIFCRRDF